MREQLGGFIGRFSVGRLRRFLSGIIYGNPFRAGNVKNVLLQLMMGDMILLMECRHVVIVMP